MSVETPAASPLPLSRTPPHGWALPRWNDPRLPFAVLLTLYGVLGFTFFGFNRSPGQMAFLVVSGTLLDAALGWGLKRQKVVPLSAYISCCSLALLLNYSHASTLLWLPVWLAIGSKYVLTFQGRHVFNPSMFAVAVSLLTTRELITAAPAYQWANGEVALSAFIVMAALVLFFFRVGRGWLVGSFLGFYAVQTALRAFILRHHLPPEVLFLGTLGAPSFFIFVFYMLTDPATSPGTRRGQVLLALAITCVDLVLHLKESVYTFFYAALTVATCRFLFLHAREALRVGALESLRRLVSPDRLRRVGVVGGLGAVLATGWAVAQTPGARAAPLTFHLDAQDLARSGLASTMGHTLEELDPRVAHVAKWLVAVGDAVATGDFDGDGKLDLFLTHPLGTPEFHAGLYRNVGDLRFERVPVPALERFATRYQEEGLAGGGTFVDWDGDGDLDLAVAVAFGPVRLLRNTLRETGAAGFEDVTEAAGVTDHAVSLGLTFLDYDRDGHLDLLVLNAMTTHLPDYPTPTPLNLFHLPAPEYAGDRRMLRFMHDGWHDANNGGKNALYRGRGDGTFQKQDADALGLKQTHWSLAVSTVDLNHDGWTDLYVANDFGPDDVYLNEGGRHFRHVVGHRFGEVGRDTYKGMNATVADFDRNGWLDVYVSNVHHALQAEGSLLWMVGPGRDAFVPEFKDEATFRGALNERRFGWGAAAGDLDDDGWPDLVQANGMVDARLDAPQWRIPEGQRNDYWYVNHKLMQSGPEVHTYADKWGDIRGRVLYPNEARRVYLNLGDAKPGHFVDVASEAGIAAPDNSRGVLLADLDDDGDLDVLITNQHAPVSLYRNTLRGGAPAAHFVGLSLVGDGQRTHRSAVGTRVVLSYEERGQRVEQVREVGLMGGFSASADPRLHFGLGTYAGPVKATIHWYGAQAQEVTLEVDRYQQVRQPPAPTASREGAEAMLSAMKGTTVRRERLDADTRARMLALMQCCYVGVSAERFHADLDAKQWVFLLHARRTGELVGFSTVRVAREGGAEVLYSGDTVIHPDWWGHKTLQVVFGRLLLARKLRRPWRPLYWLLLSGGYKTYLLAVNSFPRTHPRRDWTPPEGRAEFLGALAARWFGAQYDAGRGTLRFDGAHYRVRDGVSPIDRDAAAHPHIAYFAERNPRHGEGEELVCLVEIRGWDLVRALGRSLWGQLRKSVRRERDPKRIRVGT